MDVTSDISGTKLNLGSNTFQMKVGIVQVNTKSAWKMSDF